MDPSTAVRISSLASVRRAMRAENGRSAFDSRGGCALLGSLRVVEKAEAFEHPPFHLHAGCLVLRDNSSLAARPLQSDTQSNSAGAGSTAAYEEIRCLALNPQPSWFESSVRVLLTHWRYIPPAKPLRGKASDAWAYIEVLGAPILVSASTNVPEVPRPLSWWSKNCIYPELDLEKQLLAAIRKSPALSGTEAFSMLNQQLADSRQGRLSVQGRVVAMSALLATGTTDHSIGFLVDIAVGSAEGDSQSLEHFAVSVLLGGRRFLGLFASLFVGDSLFINELQPASLSADKGYAKRVFTTTAASQAFRVDDFEELQESLGHSQLSQTPFTQSSQAELLSQITTAHSKVNSSSQTLQYKEQQQKQQKQEKQENRNRTHAPQPRKIAFDPHLQSHEGRLESYSGEITKVLDLTVGIYVMDNCHLLALTYWPMFSPLLPLRPGTRVLAENVHIVLLSDSAAYSWSWIKYARPDIQPGEAPPPVGEQRMLVFGACARSSIRITEFAHSPDPGCVSTLVDRAVAQPLVKESQGLVRMIETAEAFWKFHAKFPHGSVPSSKSPALQNFDAAADWVGAQVSSAGAGRSLHSEFLHHSCCCTAEVKPKHAPARIIELRVAAQRFLRWQSKRQSRDAGTPANAASTKVRLTSIYPEQLQLGAMPLVGRLVVGKRGGLYLQDATGEIRVHPDLGRLSSSLVAGGDKGQGDSRLHRPFFSGQKLVGHVYSWPNWVFSIETLDAPAIQGIEHRLPSFTLVYAAVAHPALVSFDSRFGGSTDLLKQQPGNQATKEGGLGQSPQLSLLFFAHSRGALVSPSANANAWSTVSTVKGVGLEVDSVLCNQVLSTVDSDSDRITLDSDEIGMSKLQTYILTLDLSKTPVHIAPGSAYLVCIADKRSLKYHKGARNKPSSSVIAIGQGSCSHIHPVDVDYMPQASRNGSKRLKASHSEHSAAHRSKQRLHIPAVAIRVARDALSYVQTPRVYPVSAFADSTLDDKPHTCASGFAVGSIVSVYGVIQAREVKEAIPLTRNTGSCKHEQQKGNSAQTAALNAESIPALFDNIITLGDDKDPACTVAVYVKLPSFAHPLGLVPGTRFVFRDVAVNATKRSGKIYLSGTAATSFEEVSLDHTPPEMASNEQHLNTDGGSTAARVVAGDLYAYSSDYSDKLVSLCCRVDRVEQLSISVSCLTCNQAVCSMRCACPSKRHRLVAKSHSDETGAKPATVRANIELQCRVSDGSGIVGVVIRDEAALASCLGLGSSGVQALYSAAAQSWKGLLLWKPQDTANAKALDGNAGKPLVPEQDGASMALEKAAASSSNTTLRIEGYIQYSGPAKARQVQKGIRQQPLRLNREDIQANQYIPPKISVTKASAPSTLELCLELLEILETASAPDGSLQS